MSVSRRGGFGLPEHAKKGSPKYHNMTLAGSFLEALGLPKCGASPTVPHEQESFRQHNFTRQSFQIPPRFPLNEGLFGDRLGKVAEPSLSPHIPARVGLPQFASSLGRTTRSTFGLGFRVWSLGFRVWGLRFGLWGVSGLSIHAPMAPPHFQGSVGGGTSCAQRTSLMLPKKPSKLGFLQHSHPL